MLTMGGLYAIHYFLKYKYKYIYVQIQIQTQIQVKRGWNDSEPSWESLLALLTMGGLLTIHYSSTSRAPFSLSSIFSSFPFPTLKQLLVNNFMGASEYQEGTTLPAPSLVQVLAQKPTDRRIGGQVFFRRWMLYCYEKYGNVLIKIH